MAQPFTIALPPNLNLWDGCKIRVTAIDPTTGNTVSGVNVSSVSYFVTSEGQEDDLAYGPFMLVPGPNA